MNGAPPITNWNGSAACLHVLPGENDADEATLKEIPFSKFNASVFGILRSVEQTREAILITRSDKALAEIRSVPISAAPRERLRADDALHGLEHQTGSQVVVLRGAPEKRKAGSVDDETPPAA